MLPGVNVTKNPFSLPAAPNSAVGVAAYVAAAVAGPLLAATVYSDPNLAVQTYQGGPLAEYAAYHIPTANKPTVLMRSTASVAAVYGTITPGGLGTGGIQQGTYTPAATSATFPVDGYDVVVTWILGGALGTSGATYTYSLDGGNSVVGPVALGTSLILTIPNTGLSFTLGTSTETMVAGDFFECPTTRALNSDSDNLAALNAIGQVRQPIEGIYLDSQFGTSSVGPVDAILSGWEGKGIFRFALFNTRFKNPGETETAYATALETLMGSQTSERECVGADGGHLASPITALNLKRPTALALMAVAMSITPNFGTDPAYVGNGADSGFSLSNGQGVPVDHDEDLNETLDVLGLTTLRTFAQPNGPAGVYVTNANVISPNNSNIRYLQQLRVLNVACGIAWGLLTQRLSIGVDKQLNTQLGYSTITERDAQQIEEWVNPTLQSTLAGQVSSAQGTPGAALVLSRNDNLDVVPSTVNASVKVVGKAYIKNFLVTVSFAKTISS